ncbi:MAG: transposase [Bacteroides heparinolyticus]|nr:transposase [Bacteroides heparinolyticus]
MHIYLNVYEDGVSLWKGLNGYFRFYNQERPHKSLSYKTPANCYYANAA